MKVTKVTNPSAQHAMLPAPLIGSVPPRESVIIPMPLSAFAGMSWVVPQGLQLAPVPRRLHGVKGVIPDILYLVAKDNRETVTFLVEEIADHKPEIHCRRCGVLHPPGTEACPGCGPAGDVYEHFSGMHNMRLGAPRSVA